MKREELENKFDWMLGYCKQHGLNSLNPSQWALATEAYNKHKENDVAANGEQEKGDLVTNSAGETGDGFKQDNEKLRFDLVPPFIEKSLAQVLTAGVAKGYGEDSWKDVPNAKARYLAALKRHLNQFLEGEEYDNKKGGTGYHHLKNCLFNIMALLWFHEIEPNGSDVKKEIEE